MLVNVIFPISHFKFFFPTSYFQCRRGFLESSYMMLKFHLAYLTTLPCGLYVLPVFSDEASQPKSNGSESKSCKFLDNTVFNDQG